MATMIIGAIIGFVILIYSVILHEIAHGFVAEKLGDPTARNAGRLTLNPIPHIDPIWTIAVPAVLYLYSIFSGHGIILGAAKPVPINPLYFDDPKRDTALVSMAGIITNLCLAGIGAIFYHVTGQTAIFRIMVYINVVLAIFNIIPIAPLDGSKILASVLPNDLAATLLAFDRYGFIIILALLYTGVLWKIMLPIIMVIMNFLGVPLYIN